jgi:hypothetical protein
MADYNPYSLLSNDNPYTLLSDTGGGGYDYFNNVVSPMSNNSLPDMNFTGTDTGETNDWYSSLFGDGSLDNWSFDTTDSSGQDLLSYLTGDINSSNAMYDMADGSGGTDWGAMADKILSGLGGAAKGIGSALTNPMTLGSLYGGYQANKNQQQLGFYEKRLQDLMTNPDSFKMSPHWQAVYNQGLDAVNRNAATKGMLGSGNRLAELQRVGSEIADKAYNSEADRLAGLSNQRIEPYLNQVAGRTNAYTNGLADIFNSIGQNWNSQNSGG